jgi:hypothetical protein
LCFRGTHVPLLSAGDCEKAKLCATTTAELDPLDHPFNPLIILTL